MKTIEKFQTIFEQKIMPYILGLDFINNNWEYYEPIIYTLEKPSNKFRSATCFAAAEICGVTKKDVLPLAAVSELIHGSIIVQDDVADNNQTRRKNQAAWEKFGTCYSLHSSLYMIPSCLRTIKSDAVRKSFLFYLQDVYKQQIGQSLLELGRHISYESFLAIHLGKTAIGQWSITAPAMLSGNKRIEHTLLDFSRKLGDAGTIKNDTEDFMREGFKDVKTGAVTYPIYLYFNRCNQKEQSSFLHVFGQNIDFDYDQLKNAFINKGVYKDCKGKIEKLISEATVTLENLPDAKSVTLLQEWAEYHNDI
jgi:geranylgeranyl pyrophosphate synthase